MNVSQLRAAFNALTPVTGNTPWDAHRRHIRQHVQHDDPANFLNWSTIQATMFVGEAPYIRHELQALPASWHPHLQELEFGGATRLSYAPYTSGNFVHQAYHLEQWLSRTAQSQPRHIVEIGGGYGALALLSMRALRWDSYTIIDLPELNLLQEFYLEAAAVPVQFNFWLTEADLCIALFSLSEIPLTERVIPDAKEYLVAYQPQWAGVDNVGYFDAFKRTRSDLTWYDHYNPHFSNYRYLVGIQSER